jgi:hypothetical protein
MSGGLEEEPTESLQLLKAYFCTEREYAMLPGDTFGLEVDCMKPESSGRCQASAHLNHTAIQFTAQSTGRYRFLLVHCGETLGSSRTVRAHIKYEGAHSQIEPTV